MYNILQLCKQSPLCDFVDTLTKADYNNQYTQQTEYIHTYDSDNDNNNNNNNLINDIKNPAEKNVFAKTQNKKNISKLIVQKD